MTQKRFTASSLTGGINLTAEENALEFFGERKAVQSEFRDIENFAPINRGGLSKAKGFTMMQDTGTAAITGLHRYIKASNTRYFIYTAGTKAYHTDFTTSTDLGVTLSNGALTHFTTAKDTLIICDGVSAPQTWDGATASSISQAEAAASRMTAYHQNRVWYFGNTSNPSLVYYSDPLTLDAGLSVNFVNCDVNDGQKITSMMPVFIPGEFGTVMVVTKERSVGLIIGDGSTSNPYAWVRINEDAGVPGFRQLAQFGSDVAYLTPKGVTSYKTDVTDVNLVWRYISEKVRSAFLDLAQTQRHKAIMFYDTLRRRLGVACTENGSSTNNVIWFYDVALDCWYKERWRGDHDCTAVLIDDDGTWYHGDSLGRIMKHQDDLHSFHGDPINAFIKTPFLSFGSPSQRKQCREASTVIRGNGSYAVGVSSVLDYGARSNKSNQVITAGSSTNWGGTGLTWGGSGLTWGAAPIVTRRFHPSGYFRQIQFTYTNAGVDEPIDLFELHFDIVYTSQT